VDYIVHQENILETRILDTSFSVLFQDCRVLEFRRKANFERLDGFNSLTS
jgi:transposase-like protein